MCDSRANDVSSKCQFGAELALELTKLAFHGLKYMNKHPNDELQSRQHGNILIVKNRGNVCKERKERKHEWYPRHIDASTERMNAKQS